MIVIAAQKPPASLSTFISCVLVQQKPSTYMQHRHRHRYLLGVSKDFGKPLGSALDASGGAVCFAFGKAVEAPMRHLGGGPRRGPEGVWGPLGEVLGGSWEPLGEFLAVIPEEVNIRSFLEASWGRPGVVLGPSWCHLRAISGPTWGLLGPSWDHLGPSGALLGPSWRELGRLQSETDEVGKTYKNQ